MTVIHGLIIRSLYLYLHICIFCRVGSAFRFELTTPTSLYTTTPILSEESIHNFVFRPTPNTAYYIGGHPDDVLVSYLLSC